MHKGRILIAAVILYAFLFPLSAKAETFIDDNYISWTISEKNSLEDIVYDDDLFIYLQVSGELCKTKKDFSGELIELEEKEKEEIKKVKAVENPLLTVDAEHISVRANDLFFKEQKLLDVSTYIEEDECFYQENPQYERKNIYYYLRYYRLNNGNELFFLRTYIKTRIPAPYTPFYNDVLLSHGGKIYKLDMEPGFSLKRLIENGDGSVWLGGFTSSGRYIEESSLYLLDRNKNVFFINQMLKKNHIELLGEEADKLVIKAITEPMPDHYLDLDKYNTENQGIFLINSDREIEARPESLEGYQGLYLDNKNEIYAISGDNKRLINLSTGREKELEARESEFDRSMEAFEKYLLDDNRRSLNRQDLDGSLWYLKEQRIIHNVNGVEYIFDKGLDVLMYPVENIFIDFDGGKWFLGCAGIAYYGKDYQAAKNMNPLIGGKIELGAYDDLYVDGNKTVWFFDEQIKSVPFQANTVLPPENEYIQGFARLSHPYAEIEGRGLFAYQKENAGSYSLRIISIDRNARLEYSDFQLDGPARTICSYNDGLYIVLEDGLLRILNGKVYEIRNPGLCLPVCFRHIDENVIFIGDLECISIHIPAFSEKVDEFTGVSREIRFNGQGIRAFRVQNKLAICVEDLQYYGYDMFWDPNKRTSFFTYNPDKAVNVEGVEANLPGEKGDIYYSDVDIYIDGKRIRSYNTGGYSLVSLESLEDFFDVQIGDVIDINKR